MSQDLSAEFWISTKQRMCKNSEVSTYCFESRAVDIFIPLKVLQSLISTFIEDICMIYTRILCSATVLSNIDRLDLGKKQDLPVWYHNLKIKSNIWKFFGLLTINFFLGLFWWRSQIIMRANLLSPAIIEVPPSQMMITDVNFMASEEIKFYYR